MPLPLLIVPAAVLAGGALTVAVAKKKPGTAPASPQPADTIALLAGDPRRRANPDRIVAGLGYRRPSGLLPLIRPDADQLASRAGILATAAATAAAQKSVSEFVASTPGLGTAMQIIGAPGKLAAALSGLPVPDPATAAVQSIVAFGTNLTAAVVNVGDLFSPGAASAGGLTVAQQLASGRADGTKQIRDPGSPDGYRTVGRNARNHAGGAAQDSGF